MKNLLYAFWMILGGALLLVIVMPFEIIEEIKWKRESK